MKMLHLQGRESVRRRKDKPIHAPLTLSEIRTRGLLFFPRPPILLAFKISLWVVVRKKFRQDFDNVPKWFIFKCCSPKHQNIKLEQMLLGRIEGLWSHRYGREGGGVGGLWT